MSAYLLSMLLPRARERGTKTEDRRTSERDGQRGSGGNKEGPEDGVEEEGISRGERHYGAPCGEQRMEGKVCAAVQRGGEGTAKRGQDTKQSNGDVHNARAVASACATTRERC